ncbi:MAG: hypothetical protein ACOC2W_00435 [bacterium]
MINHVVHKEKAKKEIINLIKDMQKQNFIVTDTQLEQRTELILYHMYKFIFNKLSKSGILDSDVGQPGNENQKKSQEPNIPSITPNDLTFK